MRLPARPPALIVRIGPGGRLYHWTGERWTPWVGYLRDLTAVDWQAGPLPEIAAALAGLNQKSNRADS